MRVEAYRNLQRDTFSVRKAQGRVLLHCDRVFIRNADFVVQPAGRAKVLEEKRKNVHAFVRGELVGWGLAHPRMIVDKNRNYAYAGYPAWRCASYNPYYKDAFFDKNTQLAVHEAAFVVLEKTASGDYHVFYRRQP